MNDAGGAHDDEDDDDNVCFCLCLFFFVFLMMMVMIVMMMVLAPIKMIRITLMTVSFEDGTANEDAGNVITTKIR